MAVQAILFDLDDTLIDRRATMPKYAARFAADFADALDELTLEQLERAIVETDGGGYRGRDKFHDLLATLPWKKRPAVEALIEHWNTVFPQVVEPMNGLFTLLNQLAVRGYRLGLITNGQSERQNAKLDLLGIRDYFDVTLISAEVGYEKPDPLIFLLALEALGVEAEEAIYVGDHPQNDVGGAEFAGITPVWRRGCHPWPADQAEPEHQFVTLAEFLLWLEEYVS
ncbi:HAD family hydrolase [Tumebacillus permanentifrigoris]|uniref:Putative hydrolase of the HAD superfamily n=1 Tax=Tumebacillus permanentifrigoris TaxID=378543 RepID=A0A316DZ83_9BACL|nr:HAD family hydrolase [Tumebacillus permanentifrigoris]PWK15820.1 putative hydrolase of the HAD superfamily [Tumebacillus permanentifrigoris]